MHPCPIGRGLSLYSNLCIIDNEIWNSSEGPLAPSLGQPVCQGKRPTGEDRAIEYGYRVAHHGRPSESQEELPPPQQAQGEGGGGA